MKIIEIQIYGFGKLVDKTITEIGDFQVFFGENEAGKSTIMAFIHAILFGFPQKQQNESRFEPKEGTKYGGKLTVHFSGRGKAVIERVKGKSSGDVTVRMENGESGSDLLLKKLLHDMDKKLFQSIFSFNVHGLQNIHQMNGEDLGRLLFSAGALGTDQLLLAEQSLQKELDARFKPNGKKPELNQKLAEVKELYKKLQQAQQKNEEYWHLLNESEKLEKNIQSMQEQLIQCNEKSSMLMSWKQVQPVYKEKRILDKELLQYADLDFPVEGLSRYDRLVEGLRPLLAKNDAVKQRMHELLQQIREEEPNIEILDVEQDIMNISEQLPLMQKYREEERTLSLKLSSIQEEIQDLSDKLNLSLPEDELLLIDTSIHKQKQVSQAQDDFKRLIVKKTDLDEQFNESTRELSLLEEKVTQLQELLLSKDEEVELQQKLNEIEERSRLEKELQEYSQRNKDVNTRRTGKREQSKSRINDIFPAVVFAVFFLIIAAWSLLNKEWLIAIVTSVGFLYVLFNIYSKSNAKNEWDTTDFEKQQHDIEKRLKELQKHDLSSISFLASQNDERKMKVKELEIILQQEITANEKIIAGFERWEEAFLLSKKRLQELCLQLHLPSKDETALEHIGEAFQLLEQLKTVVKRKNSLQLEHSTTVESLQKLTDKIEALASRFHIHSSMNYEEQVYELRRLLKRELEKKTKEKENKRKLKELQAEEQTCLLEINQYQSEQSELMELAQAGDEEQFRELAKKAERKDQIAERIKALNMQLDISPLSMEQMDFLSGETEYNNNVEELTELANSLENSISASQKKLAELQYETKVIEEGGTHAELLHHYKQVKSELDKDAGVWAKYAAAEHILKKTIAAFKDERLPKILAKAEGYLSILTEGEYVRIWPKHRENGFYIENKSKTAFEVFELSQASKEQVYVAIRLALAETAYKSAHYPLIIDDSFVNFDHKRIKQMIRLLRTMTNRQILFFTCHQHLLSYFHEKETIALTAPANTQESSV